MQHGYTLLRTTSAHPHLPQIERHLVTQKNTPIVGILGPIIGEVTHKSVRVVMEVEVCVTLPLTCTVESLLDGKKFTSTRLTLPGMPLLFEFSDLAPDASYKVSFSPLQNTEAHRGRFRTCAKRPSRMRLCFVLGSDPIGQVVARDSETDRPEQPYLDRTTRPSLYHNPAQFSLSMEAVGSEVLDRQYAWHKASTKVGRLSITTPFYWFNTHAHMHSLRLMSHLPMSPSWCYQVSTTW